MTFVLAILFVTVIVFACVCFHLFIRLGDAEGRIALLEVKANYSEKSEKTLRESVDIQTKCIRDLNDIVKKSVENKQPTEPDTKALLAGWIVEEQELPKEQPQQIDRFRMSKLVNSLHYRNISPNIAALYPCQQSVLYPWQQAELNQILGPYGIREEWTK